MPVSILILLEVILEDCTVLLFVLPFPGFNPYFTGSNSGSLSDYSGGNDFINVSILILLEVILEVQNSRRVLTISNGFNPYFTGSNSGSKNERRFYVIEMKFQSLFYWK